jgi:hypothetical protein
LFGLVGIGLHARRRSKQLELDDPPSRMAELTHRAYDVKALEARRGWLLESFTYASHHRNNTAEVVEEPPPALAEPGGIEEPSQKGLLWEG